MRKLLLLTLACVVWIGAGPRPASAGCGRDTGSNDIIARPSYTALLQGVLEELPLVRCPRPAGWILYANGQQFYVDFGTNAELLAQAKKLNKIPVEISGTLEDTGLYENLTYHLSRAGCDIGPIYSRVRILHATSLTTLADPEGTPVEITGELTYVELESYPPIQVWMLKTDKKTYGLRFNSAALADQTRRLRHGSVTVIGKLSKGDTITVTGLVHQDTSHILLPSYPEENPPHVFEPVIAK